MTHTYYDMYYDEDDALDESELYDDSSVDYVHMSLPDGSPVRFKRMWAGYVFTEEEIDLLMRGCEICITTDKYVGIRGSLDWQEYNGYEYFGFAPWAAESYTIDNAPIPRAWGGYVFSEEEHDILRTGEKLLIMPVSQKTGSAYAVQVSFDIINNPDWTGWGIVPHFDEFSMPGNAFTRDACLFTPVFSDKVLTQKEIAHVRQGRGLHYEGVSKTGKRYECQLFLRLDKRANRWRLTPQFYN